MATSRRIGHSVKRKEDPRFLRGKGTYVDDVKLPGMLYLDIVRSPYAHAKITNIDARPALAMPGVLAVITGKDLDAAGLAWMPTLMSDPQMVLPVDTVVYQSQEVAAVVADSRYAAADGVRRSRSTTSRCRSSSTRSRRSSPTRRSCGPTASRRPTTSGTGRRATPTATERAFDEAEVVVEQDMYIPRIHVASIETCGCVASVDSVSGKLTSG